MQKNKGVRSISIEKLDNGRIRKRFSITPRKGLDKDGWRREMMNEVYKLIQMSSFARVPHVYMYSSIDNYFEMEYMGEPLELGKLDYNKVLDIIFKVKEIEARMISQFNIFHNDITWSNIVQKDGDINLIDFGWSSFGHSSHPHFTYENLLKSISIDRLGLMLEAFELPKKSTATGGSKSYYRINFEGEIFDGTRDWEARWHHLKNITSFDNKNILELGCNSGLLSTYIAKEFRPNFVLGVDRCKHIILSAHLIALAMNSKAYFYQLTLSRDLRCHDSVNTPNWECILGDRWDLIFCLSFHRWVEDKKSLMEFLFKAKEVIFENHDNLYDPTQIENMFTEQGFKSEVVYRGQGTDSYYDRTLMYFRKHRI